MGAFKQLEKEMLQFYHQSEDGLRAERYSACDHLLIKELVGLHGALKFVLTIMTFATHAKVVSTGLRILDT